MLVLTAIVLRLPARLDPVRPAADPSRRARRHPPTIGSGNIGATNVLRTGNKGLAAATLLLDGAKGAAAVLLGAWSLGGYAAVLWAGARRGARPRCSRSGSASRAARASRPAYGVLIAAAWPVGLVAGAVWLVVAALARISSARRARFLRARAGRSPGRSATPAVVKLALVIAVLMFVRHHANIRRLLAGTEPRIGQAKRESTDRPSSRHDRPAAPRPHRRRRPGHLSPPAAPLRHRRRRARRAARPRPRRRPRRRPDRPARRDDAERELRALDAARRRIMLFADEPDYPPLLALLDDAPPVIAVLGDAGAAVRPRRRPGRRPQRLGQRPAHGREPRRRTGALGSSWSPASRAASTPRRIAARCGPGAPSPRSPAASTCPTRRSTPICNAASRESGAVVTEAPLGTAPQARHFPAPQPDHRRPLARRRGGGGGAALGQPDHRPARPGGRARAVRRARLAARSALPRRQRPDPPGRAPDRDRRRTCSTTCPTTPRARASPASRCSPHDPPPGLAEPPPDWQEPAGRPPDLGKARRQVIDLLGTSPTAVDDVVRRCQFSAAAVMAVAAGTGARRPHRDAAGQPGRTAAGDRILGYRQGSQCQTSSSSNPPPRPRPSTAISAAATPCWPAWATCATCRRRTARCGPSRTSPWTGSPTSAARSRSAPSPRR